MMIRKKRKRRALSHGTCTLLSFVLGINVQLASHLSRYYPTPISLKTWLITHIYWSLILLLKLPDFWCVFPGFWLPYVLGRTHATRSRPVTFPLSTFPYPRLVMSGFRSSQVCRLLCREI